MGLHASYYPISPPTLADFITNWHAEGFWQVTSKFREDANNSGQRLYIGTTWHVLDFVINPPNDSIPELIYAVRGHEFPAPDGSIQVEPHMPSYGDEHWQGRTYVTAEEVKVIAQYLSLIDEPEFNSRFVSNKMKNVYRRPGNTKEGGAEYFEILIKLLEFYQQAASNEMAVLISIG